MSDHSQEDHARPCARVKNPTKGGYKKAKLEGQEYAVVAAELFKAVAKGQVHRDAIGVWAVLWQYTSDETGEAWPKYATIARELSMSSRQAMRIVKRLCDLGFIDRRHRKKENKDSQTSNAYMVHFKAARGDHESPVGVTDRHTINKDLYKKPSLNSTVTKTGALVEASRERDLGKERNDGPFDEPSSQPDSGLSRFEETKASEADAVVERVCRRIQSQRVKMGEPKPKITEEWESDIRRLLANGSSSWAEKKPIPAEKVESLSVWALNNKFWSSRIPNPAALSRNWTRIERASEKATQPVGAVLDVRGGDSPAIDLRGPQVSYTPVRPELQERTPFNLDPDAATTGTADAKSRIANIRGLLKESHS